MRLRSAVMNRLSTVLVDRLAAILAGSVGCARKPDDAKISSDIKGKCSQDSGLSPKQLSVQASNGVVTLAGFVDNDAQGTAAALQAASVAGVKEVVNNLQVGSADIAAVQPGAKAAGTRPHQSSKPIRSKRRPANASDGSPWYDSAPGSTAAGARSENSPQALPPQDTASAEAKPSTPPPPPPPTSQKATIEQGTSISIGLTNRLDTEK